MLAWMSFALGYARALKILKQNNCHTDSYRNCVSGRTVEISASTLLSLFLFRHANFQFAIRSY